MISGRLGFMVCWVNSLDSKNVDVCHARITNEDAHFSSLHAHNMIKLNLQCFPTGRQLYMPLETKAKAPTASRWPDVSQEFVWEVNLRSFGCTYISAGRTFLSILHTPHLLSFHPSRARDYLDYSGKTSEGKWGWRNQRITVAWLKV